MLDYTKSTPKHILTVKQKGEGMFLASLSIGKKAHTPCPNRGVSGLE